MRALLDWTILGGSFGCAGWYVVRALLRGHFTLADWGGIMLLLGLGTTVVSSTIVPMSTPEASDAFSQAGHALIIVGGTMAVVGQRAQARARREQRERERV